MTRHVHPKRDLVTVILIRCIGNGRCLRCWYFLAFRHRYIIRIFSWHTEAWYIKDTGWFSWNSDDTYANQLWISRLIRISSVKYQRTLSLFDNFGHGIQFSSGSRITFHDIPTLYTYARDTDPIFMKITSLLCNFSSRSQFFFLTLISPIQ